jgi:hypothetical protein
MIQIMAPLDSRNVVVIRHDLTAPDFDVTVNGSMTTVPDAGIRAVYYDGGQGGDDIFANSTNLIGIEYGFGGGNTFIGGTNADYAFLWGNSNTFSVTAGEFAVIYTHGGQHNHIIGTPYFVYAG